MKPNSGTSSPEPDDLAEVPPGSAAIFTSEVEDLERELRAVRRKENRHFVWAVLGVSPAAIIPALGLVREGSLGLLVLLAVLVTVSQGYLGAKASRKAEHLEAALEELKKAQGS